MIFMFQCNILLIKLVWSFVYVLCDLQIYYGTDVVTVIIVVCQDMSMVESRNWLKYVHLIIHNNDAKFRLPID